MCPVLFVGEHTINSRDLFINLGSAIAIVFLLVMYYRAYRNHPENRGGVMKLVALPVLLELLVVGTIGNALAMVVRGLTFSFAESLTAELSLIREVGGSHFIGIVFASACLLPCLYRWVYQADADKMLDIMAFFFPIQHVFNRIGCFMEGCCYGIPMSGPLSVRFPKNEITYSVFPSQLFEAALMLILFVGLCVAYWKGKHIFYPSMAAFGLCILISECMMDKRGTVMYLGMTAIQITSVLLVIAAAWGYYVRRRRERAS